jgi:hypothetical protein
VRAARAGAGACEEEVDVDRNGKGVLRGEIVQSFILMGLMAVVLGAYFGIAMLAVRAFG